MLIITLKTDQPEAELSLRDDGKLVEAYHWLAHRQLAETLHQQLRDLLARHDYQLSDVQGLVVFQGPGSFTGLRIGISVVNALAYALNVPAVGTTGDDWEDRGCERLSRGEIDGTVIPTYGALPHITQQKK